MTTVQWE